MREKGEGGSERVNKKEKNGSEEEERMRERYT